MPRKEITPESLALCRRRRKIAALYLKGLTQIEIAARVGLDQTTVSRDLKIVQEHWRESAVRDFEQMRAEELAQVRRLQTIYEEAWRWSRKKKVTKETETRPVGEGQLTLILKQKRKVEQRDGDSAFLEGVRWCITARRELFGLDAPQRTENVNHNLDWDKLLLGVPAQVPDEVQQALEQPLLEARSAKVEDGNGVRDAVSEAGGANGHAGSNGDGQG